MQKIVNFLMFTGQAEAAMNFYMATFPNSKIVDVKWNEPKGEESRTVMRATFLLNGQTFMCIDSPPVHQFTFTPSISFYIDCESAEEIETLYKGLSDQGSVMMPLGAYPFSKQYAWVADKFGVSWQLNHNS